MSRPIVFLDCDGVLANSHAHSSPQWCRRLLRRRPDAVSALGKRPRPARVPVSRTTGSYRPDHWSRRRADHDLAAQCRTTRILGGGTATYGVHVIGDTPNIGFDRRGEEVVAWLKENAFDGRFVIIDDGHYSDFACRPLGPPRDNDHVRRHRRTSGRGPHAATGRRRDRFSWPGRKHCAVAAAACGAIHTHTAHGSSIATSRDKD